MGRASDLFMLMKRKPHWMIEHVRGRRMNQWMTQKDQKAKG
jgi:hypothetical protein